MSSTGSLGIFRQAHGTFARILHLSLLIAAGGFAFPAQAQSPITSSTDGSTPLAIAPGAPAGSFPLSGFDNVNLYNGHLNFRLPFLQVNGRGDARYSMTLAIDARKWRVERLVNPGTCSGGPANTSTARTRTGGVTWSRDTDLA